MTSGTRAERFRSNGEGSGMNRGLCALLLVLVLRPVSAGPVTFERINNLPATEQTAWQKYLARSEATARADQAALQAEVTANGMTTALPAPEGGDFKLP